MPIENAEYSQNSPSPAFTVVVNETNIESMWYTFQLDGPKYFFEANGSLDLNAWSALPNGIVTVRFYVKDTGGNEVMKSIVVVKNIPPFDPLPVIIAIAAVGTVVVGVTIHKRRHQRGSLTDLNEQFTKLGEKGKDGKVDEHNPNLNTRSEPHPNEVKKE